MTKSKDQEPRILVIAEFAPGAAGGDWVNIKQHFRGLDWSQIYWWSFSGPSGIKSHEFGGKHSSCQIPPRLTPNQKWNGLKSWILDSFIIPHAARHLLSFIRLAQPDFIFLMARGWMIPLGHRVMPQVKAHWHVALYDMPDVDGMMQRLGRQRTDRFMNMADALYRNASSRSVISPAMAEEMRMRTGVACSTFFRCSVEPEALARLRQPLPPPQDDVIRIGYAGSILAEPTFVRLVKALQMIRPQLGHRVEIHLYGSQRYTNRDWFDSSLIIEHGFISEAELHRLYQQGTWGLAIMHLDDTDPRYNLYSFPCKFTMSLASGLPLICIGHPQSPLIELARNYRLGLLLTENDDKALAQRLLEGLADFSRFGEYRAGMARCAEKEVNAEQNRRKLHELLYATCALARRNNPVTDTKATDSRPQAGPPPHPRNKA
ncbi:MAG TPA: glycosyltransferase [Candidatus Methylacidiphilales bacterium]|nr:glycosyltransferase [Candidatus Methylacidiphilales bacterium]